MYGVMTANGFVLKMTRLAEKPIQNLLRKINGCAKTIASNFRVKCIFNLNIEHLT